MAMTSAENVAFEEDSDEMEEGEIEEDERPPMVVESAKGQVGSPEEEDLEAKEGRGAIEVEHETGTMEEGLRQQQQYSPLPPGPFPPPPFLHHSGPQRPTPHYQPEHPFIHHQHPHFIPPPSPAPHFYPPPPPQHDPIPVRELVRSSTQVINELLSFGVSPEYLVGYGVSKELIAIAFNELHFLLPPHLAHLAPPPGEGWKRPQEVFGARGIKRQRTEESSSESASPEAPVKMEVDLKEMEIRKRQELMARKKAIASRNEMKANALQSEIETLFRATPPADEHAEDQDGVGHLRHSITHTEQTINLPTSGPFATSSRINSPSNQPQQRPYHSGRMNRPSAADFLGDDQTLVIDLSGDEDSDVEIITPSPNKKTKITSSTTPSPPEAVDVDSETSSDDEDELVTASLLLPRTQQPGSGRITPSRTSSTSSASKTVAQKQLEEKELEIKLIMEKIKQMEGKKKGKSTATMERSSSTGSESSRIPAVKEAKEFVEELKKDRKELLAVTQVEKELTMDVDEKSKEWKGKEKATTELPPEAKLSASVPLEPLPSVIEPAPKPSLFTRFFKPYISPLASSSSAATSSFSQATPSNFRSYVAKKKGLDTNKRLCKFEMDGEGRCSDATCRSLHFRDFEGNQQDITDFLIATIKLPPTSTHPGKQDPREEILKRGLGIVLDVNKVGKEGRTFEQAKKAAVDFVGGMLAPQKA